jgi:hypothetical protein
MFLVIFGANETPISDFATLSQFSSKSHFSPGPRLSSLTKKWKCSKLLLTASNRCKNMFLVIFGANETPISDFATLSQFSSKSHFSAGPRLPSLNKK